VTLTDGLSERSGWGSVMSKLSVFVTTYNNAETLSACLESVAFADEIVVLDSFSEDATPQIARAHGARLEQHAFLGYGRQKQLALEHTTHPWVLFLDADEMLSTALCDALIAARERGFEAEGFAGYEMPRVEQVFWRMSGTGTRKNHYLRLFQRSLASFTEMPVHATVSVQGPIGRIDAPFYHFGETDIHTKVAKVNAYSTGLVRDKVARGQRPSPWILVFYPPLFFVRSFIFKRGFTNGWAGFIASVVGSFYVFLKYAKLYEHHCFERAGDSTMPRGAPPLKSPTERFGEPL
jgi:glycosyltransferase involved in cell wall biosynthesis